MFVLVAVSTGLVAELARARSREAEQRRREADLASEMAQLLLGAADLEGAMRLASSRLAAAVGVPSATISLCELEAEEGSSVLYGWPPSSGSTSHGSFQKKAKGRRAMGKRSSPPRLRCW